MLGMRDGVEVVAAVADGGAAVSALEHVARRRPGRLPAAGHRRRGGDAEPGARRPSAPPLPHGVRGRREGQELLTAGASAGLRKDQEFDAIVAAIGRRPPSREPQGRRTRRSSSTRLPTPRTPPTRSPNWRSCRSTSASARRLQGRRRFVGDDFYERLRAPPEFPRRRSRRPRDFLAATASSHQYRADPLARPLGECLGDVHERRERRGGARSRSRAGGRPPDGVRTIGMLALAIQRRLESGTTDEEIGELIDRSSASAACCSPSTRSSSSSAAADRKSAGVCRRAAPREADPHGRRRRGTSVKLASAATARRSRSSSTRSSPTPRDEPGLRVGLAHADAPERPGRAREDGARPPPAGDDRDGGGSSAR